MLPTTLSWIPTTLSWIPTTLSTLLLVCLAVSISQTSGDEETVAKRMLPLPTNPPPRINMCEDKQPGQMYCRNDEGDPMIGDMCYCVGEGSHDSKCLHLDFEDEEEEDVSNGQDCCVPSYRLCINDRNPETQTQFNTACGGWGWIYKFGRCWLFTRTNPWEERPYNWDRANQACEMLTGFRERDQGRGAGLIAPKTANENNFAAFEIKKLVRTYHPDVASVQVFIGLKFSEDSKNEAEGHGRTCWTPSNSPHEICYYCSHCNPFTLQGWHYTQGWTSHRERPMRHRPYLGANWKRTHWTGAWQNSDEEQFGPNWDYPPSIGRTEGTSPLMTVIIAGSGPDSNVWTAVPPTYELPDYWEHNHEDKKRKILACEKPPIYT